MKFYPLNKLGGHDDQAVFEAYGYCKSLPMKVAAVDYGYWGIKAVTDDTPNGVTFITLMGQQTAFGDIGSGLTGASARGIRLVNEELGTHFLFGRAATNQADPSTLVRRINANDNLVQQFMWAAFSASLRPGRSHLALVVGLPNNDMKVEPYKAQLRDSLKGLHVFSDGENTWEVLVTLVMFQPQASGAMFYSLIDENGRGTDELETVRSATTAHITVGGGTAELLYMRPIRDDEGRWKVQPDFLRSKSRPAGINILRQHLRDTVFGDLTSTQMPNDAEIDDMIEVRTNAHGKPVPQQVLDGERAYAVWWDGRPLADGTTRGWVNLDPFIKQGEAKMATAVERLIAETAGIPNVDIQYVFVAGGAAPRVADTILSIFGGDRVFMPGQRPGMTQDELDEAQAPDHPERIVAHGLYRYGRYELARYLARQS